MKTSGLFALFLAVILAALAIDIGNSGEVGSSNLGVMAADFNGTPTTSITVDPATWIKTLSFIRLCSGNPNSGLNSPIALYILDAPNGKISDMLSFLQNGINGRFGTRWT